MMNANNAMNIKNIIKRVGGSIMLPLAMYLIMMIFCRMHGVTYFGTLQMWKILIVDIAVSVSCAMGIGLQFKCGRFDFSGGSIMLLTAIIAGNLAVKTGNNIPVFVITCLVSCVLLSLGVALVYVYGRLPIMIATIGMTLIYESVTNQMFGGGGINLVNNLTLKWFSTYPGVLIPLIGTVIVYAFYSYVSTSGKEAVLLANNQQAAVNIGINERKNVIVSFLFSGLIFGFATMIYVSTGIHEASYSSLSTVGELFSNILPVFVGLYIGAFCGDTIGIIMGSLTMCLMSFGLESVLKAEMGSAVSLAMTGIFVLGVNLVAGQAGNLKKIWEKMTVRTA